MNAKHLVALMLVAGITANVYAAPPQEPLTVTVQGDGTVTSDPAGITCPTDCDESYRKNTSITLTATADPNSSFLGWNGACVGTDPICVVKMTAPTIVSALFDTATVVYPAPVPQTGQTGCWDDMDTGSVIADKIDCTGTAQDGELQKGVPWPIPRFTDNGDGSVTDNLTGLVWLKNTNCFGNQEWLLALTSTGTLADGACGLTDGSIQGAWRLPNVKEFQSILSFQVPDPSLPAVNIWALPEGHPFINLDGSLNVIFWTSTTVARDSQHDSAYVVHLNDGLVWRRNKLGPNLVWPVRDSQ